MDSTRRAHSIRPSHLSYACLGSFLLTIFLLQWWQMAVYPVEVWVMLGIIGAVGTVGARHAVPLRIASMIGIALAFITVARTTHITNPSTIDSFAHGKTVTIQGTISDAPDDRQTFIQYTVDAATIQTTTTGAAIPVTGKILIKDLRHWPRYNYGDLLTVRGQLDRPKATDTFAYDNYLSRFGIYTTMRAASINLESSDHGNPIIATLIRIREGFETQINRVFPEPHASFLAGLLTGSRKGMPDSLSLAFKQTGLTHIVAISGFNITIIIAIISSMLFFLPLKWRFIPSVISIILFTLFVGASASVVRASVMGILGLLALQTGRIRHARLAILWTAFFMLLWNPKLLWYDAGFQLSFLAVIGLTETMPLLERVWHAKPLQNIPTTLGIREGLTMTIAAQVFAMPWVVLQFGTLSLISPIANILVAPLIPLAMLFGFLGTMISFILFPLGQLIGFAGWGCMELILLITTTLAAVPYASVTIAGMNAWIVGIYYVLLIAGLIILHRRSHKHHH